MKIRTKLGISIVIIVALFCIARAEAGGIGTPFGKVIIENLSIGKTYTTSKLSNLFLTVKNNTEAATGLEMEILKPSPGRKLPEGCEPIPDTSWLRLEKYAFNIAPAEEAKTDVIISIPDNEAYKGKKYVVFILSRTTQGTIRLALESALILGISKSEHQSTLSSKGLEPDSRNFLIEPESFSVKGIEVDKSYSIKELAERPFCITNMGEKRYRQLPGWIEKILKLFRIKWVGEIGHKYTISSIPVPEYLMKEGYEAIPEASFLKFKCKKRFWFRPRGVEYKSKVDIEINGKETKEIEDYIEFPEGTDEYKGKRYVLAIQVESAGAKRYVRGFIETAK